MKDEAIYCKGAGEPMFRWIKKQIKKQGFGVINVFPTRDDLNADWFHYTVGNHGVGLPELLLIGPDQRGAPALTDLAKIMRKKGTAFANGELISLGGKYPVKVINLDCDEVHDHYTCAVGRHYGTESYSVQQMMIPDRDGRYPDEPACAEPYASFRVRSPSGMAVPWSQLQGFPAH